MLQGKPQKWCKTLISDIRYPTAERAEMFFYQLPRAAYGRKVEFVTCSPHSIQLNIIWGNILSFQKKQVIRLGNTNPGHWTSAVGNQMADEWSNKHVQTYLDLQKVTLTSVNLFSFQDIGPSEFWLPQQLLNTLSYIFFIYFFLIVLSSGIGVPKASQSQLTQLTVKVQAIMFWTH